MSAYLNSNREPVNIRKEYKEECKIKVICKFGKLLMIIYGNLLWV